MIPYINFGLGIKILSKVFFAVSMLIGVSSSPLMTSSASAKDKIAAENTALRPARHADFLADKGFIYRRTKKAKHNSRQERIIVSLAKRNIEAGIRLFTSSMGANASAECTRKI